MCLSNKTKNKNKKNLSLRIIENFFFHTLYLALCRCVVSYVYSTTWARRDKFSKNKQRNIQTNKQTKPNQTENKIQKQKLFWIFKKCNWLLTKFPCFRNKQQNAIPKSKCYLLSTIYRPTKKNPPIKQYNDKTYSN